MNDTITATDFARNVSSVIDKVRLTGKSVDITKGLQTVVAISPPINNGYAVLTSNTDDFKKIPGLIVECPSS